MQEEVSTTIIQRPGDLYSWGRGPDSETIFDKFNFCLFPNTKKQIRHQIETKINIYFDWFIEFCILVTGSLKETSFVWLTVDIVTFVSVSWILCQHDSLLSSQCQWWECRYRNIVFLTNLIIDSRHSWHKPLEICDKKQSPANKQSSASDKTLIAADTVQTISPLYRQVLI